MKILNRHYKISKLAYIVSSIWTVLMKGLDGFEVYSNMRNIDENVQVCFITASNTFFEKYKKLYPGIEKEFHTKANYD